MIKYTSTILLFSALIIFSGCTVAVSPAREAYILAKSHGWIELSINDSSVPSMPQQKSDNANKEYPTQCSITVSINNESYLSEPLFPSGENAPFTISTGFRITVPEGQSQIKLSYSGCRIENNKLISDDVEAIVQIHEGFVSPIYFDGTNLIVGEIEKNNSVTLEFVDARLRNIEASIESLK